MKTIIERGASWTLEETKFLLHLWGQDHVERKNTGAKRNKEFYEKISEKFAAHGYERTAEQVRTRVFNMIAEYRRILKNPEPERIKRCFFYDALDKIYQAQHPDDVKSALDDYDPEYPNSPTSNTILSEKGDESISDSEANRGNDTIINNSSTATNNNGTNDGTTANSNNSKSATSDNNGDSINDTNGADPHPSAKKIKLESPKSGSNHTTNHSEQANADSNQAKSSSSASNQGGPSNASASTNNASSAATTATSSATIANATPSSSGPKNQSLLLSHGTSSATSTPINKLASSSNSSYININSTKLPIIRTNQLIGHSNGNDSVNGTSARLPTTAAITSHQLYQAPVNTFDVTSSALLIDRMFAHLSKESETIRERIALEKDRLAYEKLRRAQDAEREVRRERVLIDTLMRFQEQWISYLKQLHPSVTANLTESPPELNLHQTETHSSSGTSNSELQVKSTNQPAVPTSSMTNTSMTSSTTVASGVTGTMEQNVIDLPSSGSDQSPQLSANNKQ